MFKTTISMPPYIKECNIREIRDTVDHEHTEGCDKCDTITNDDNLKIICIFSCIQYFIRYLSWMISRVTQVYNK